MEIKTVLKGFAGSRDVEKCNEVSIKVGLGVIKCSSCFLSSLLLRILMLCVSDTTADG